MSIFFLSTLFIKDTYEKIVSDETSIYDDDMMTKWIEMADKLKKME